MRQGSRLRAIVVGAAGTRGQFLLRLVHQVVEVVASVDPLSPVSLSGEPPSAPRHFRSVEEALATQDFDLAVLSVPHDQYHSLIPVLLRAGKAVVREKPFAVDLQEAEATADLVRQTHCPVFTITQRRHNPAFRQALAHLPDIGKPYAFEYRYYLAASGPTQGWRSERHRAGKGVGLDMGYHVVDLLADFFGLPTKAQSQRSFGFEGSRAEDLEDFLAAQLNYDSGNLVGTMTLARYHAEKQEVLEILGRLGVLSVTPSALRVLDFRGGVTHTFQQTSDDSAHTRAQLEYFIEHLRDHHFYEQELERGLSNMRVLDMIYRASSSTANV
jgi:predicted dehydrogenase